MTATRTHRLRITLRCLAENLGFDDDGRTYDEIAALDDPAGQLVAAFLSKRRETPVGKDRIGGLATGGIPIYSLHSGRARGLTWHDQDHDTVWLVAAHLSHSSGEKHDSYPYFRSLAGKSLLPSHEDYVRLREDEADEAAEAILSVLDPARKDAIEHPGEEIRVRVGPVLVSLLGTRVDPPAHIKAAISMKWTEPDFDPPPSFVLAIVTRVYGQEFADWAELPFADDLDTFGSRRTQDELVFEWYVEG